MIQDILDRERLAANVAGDFILGVDFHNDLRRRLHEPIRAARALIVIPPTAIFTEELPTVGIPALKRLVDNLLADAAQKVLVEAVDRWVA